MRRALYFDVAAEIRKMIESGVYKPGDKLASEVDLAKQIGVSRGTLREALTMLEKEGLIVRKHCRGAYVSDTPNKVKADVDRLDYLIDTIRQSGFSASDKVLSIEEIELTSKASELLKVYDKSEGYAIESLRLLNDEPIIYVYDVIPAWLFEDRDILQLRLECESLKQFFSTYTEYIPKRYCSTLNAELAPRRVCKLLNVTSRTPMIYMEGVMYDTNDNPITYGYQYYRGDKYQFTLESNR